MLGSGWRRLHDERRPQPIVKITSRSASGTKASASSPRAVRSHSIGPRHAVSKSSSTRTVGAWEPVPGMRASVQRPARCPEPRKPCLQFARYPSRNRRSAGSNAGERCRSSSPTASSSSSMKNGSSPSKPLIKLHVARPPGRPRPPPDLAPAGHLALGHHPGQSVHTAADPTTSLRLTPGHATVLTAPATAARTTPATHRAGVTTLPPAARSARTRPPQVTGANASPAGQLTTIRPTTTLMAG
jgi:hypothetical protein